MSLAHSHEQPGVREREGRGEEREKEEGRINQSKEGRKD